SGPPWPPSSTRPARRCRIPPCRLLRCGRMTELAGRLAARLTRLSFVDGARAGELLTGEPLCWWDAERNEPVDDAAAVVVAALGRTADPDAALAALADVAASEPHVRATVETDADLRARLLAVLGASSELAAHLRAHPDHWRMLAGDLDAAGAPGRLA